jgi:hypothetical protein
MHTVTMIMVVLVLLIGFSSVMQSRAESNRFESYIISGIPYEMGSLMMINIRQYMVTGDEDMLQRYRDLLRSRDGDRSWSDIDDYSMFDFMKRYGKLNFKQLALLENFTDDEMFEFNECLKNYDDIEEIENEALNLKDGYRDLDGSGSRRFKNTSGFIRFGTKGEPDRQGAVNLLYSSKYMIANENAYKSWKKAIGLVYQRVTGNVSFYSRLKTVLILLLALVAGYAFMNKEQTQ